jgi:hypothetical protein
MPLAEQEPQLDDRTFEDLYRDLRLRIQRYSKEWTNFNESDPGITLLQLFAWLSEMMLVRMNQIPRKNYFKFLKLLGQDLRPALPATAHLSFFTKATQRADTVPERAQISAQIPDGGPPVIFETLQPLDLIQAPLAVVGVSDSGSLLNVTAANDKPGTLFRPLGWFAGLGSALYLGFESVAATAGLLPFPEEMTFRVFLPPQATEGKPQRSDDPIPSAPVGLIWEYRPRDGADWERLNVFTDESAAFTREGYIRVEGPAEIELSQEPRLGAEPRYWIRARLDSGRYPNGGPEIDFIRANTVPAENLVTVKGSILGDSEGLPNTIFTLPFRPVQPASLQIVSEVNGQQPETWERVDDFLASKEDDAHFILNPTEGAIQFGDGEFGRIPQALASIVAPEFRYGGGARANQATAGTIKNQQSVLNGVDRVTNEHAAVGGEDEQTVAELMREAPAMAKSRQRAVTAKDFESFAREAGGVANVVALANTHPDFPGVDVAGAVTVIIVPDNGGTPPQPSSDLIASVCARLETRRLITTEVYVTGPEYRQVRVEAFIQAKANASFDSVSRNVKKALTALLNPKVWIFGRDLHGSAIFREVLDADDNIVGVKNLNIYVDGRPVDALTQIPLTKRQLVYGGDHLIVVVPEEDK